MEPVSWKIPKKVERAGLRSGCFWGFFVVLTTTTFLVMTTMLSIGHYFQEQPDMHPFIGGLICAGVVAGMMLALNILLYAICPTDQITLDANGISNGTHGTSQKISHDQIYCYSIVPSLFMPEVPALTIKFIDKEGSKSSDTFPLSEDVTEKQICEIMESHGIVYELKNQGKGEDDEDIPSLIEKLNDD